MAYIQIEDKLSGWLATRQRDNRKQGIKKVIGKLQQLTCGLLPKELLTQYEKPIKFETHQNHQIANHSTSSFYRTNLLSQRKNRKRQTQSSLQSRTGNQQAVETAKSNFHLQRDNQFVSDEMNETVRFLKLKNYEMPRTLNRPRNKNKLLRSKPELLQNHSPTKSKYEKRRSQMFRRKPEQPDRSSKYLLRNNIIRMMEDNFRVRSYSRLSNTN